MSFIIPGETAQQIRIQRKSVLSEGEVAKNAQEEANKPAIPATTTDEMSVDEPTTKDEEIKIKRDFKVPDC